MVPVLQIFELVMENPKLLIHDIIRDEKNKYEGLLSIKEFFKPIS